MVSWYTSTLPPEFNKKKMYEENQAKIFKTYSNMFATLKTTLGARAQANHAKIGICDHFGKQHNQ